MKGGGYLLGLGESPPDKAANEHALALLGNGVNRIELELQQRATSLVAFTEAAGAASWHFRDQVLKQLEVNGHKARTG